MNKEKIEAKLRIYTRLMRADKPIGTMLLLWPTLWALWAAAGGMPDIAVLAAFVLGTFLMRSAGCVANDFADSDFDGRVARTKNRPFARGEVSGREALLLILVLCAAAALCLLPLNRLTWLMSLPALFLAFTYPFTKRFFPIPQLYLGLAFSFGIPMAFAAVRGSVPPPAWILFAANVFWTLAYDTAYAMADKPDDGSSADAALSAQSTSLEQIVTASDTTTPGGATKKDVDAVRAAVADVVAARDAIVLAVDGAPDDPSKPSLSGSLKDLRTAVTDLRSGYDALSASVDKLDRDQTAAAAGVRTAFDKTAKETTDAVSTTVGTQIRLIGAQAGTSRAAVGASFDAATSGMRASADGITSDSARTIQEQTAQIQDQAAGSSAALSSQVEGSLTSMTQGLTGSVVDIEAARSLLTSDLDRVLLDIGSPDGSGTGLVGIMYSSAALTGSAGYQVAAANQAVAAHGAVRAQDMEGILLQQAQVKASLQAQSRVNGLAAPRPAAEQRTVVYSLRVGGSR